MGNHANLQPSLPVALATRTKSRVANPIDDFGRALTTILFRLPEYRKCHIIFGLLGITCPVNYLNVVSCKPLFLSRNLGPFPARAIYRVGGLRGAARAITSRSSLVAYCFPDLGNSHGTASLALSFNGLGEWAGAKGGRHTRAAFSSTTWTSWSIRIYLQRF